MSNLVWTQAQPKEPGWYWVMFRAWDNDPIIMHMVKHFKDFYFDGEGSLFPEQVKWWAGPVVMPTVAQCSHCKNEFEPGECPLTFLGGPMCEPCWEQLGDE